MSNTDHRQGKPIFIHSLFRSGSTYLFNVFRRSRENYWCYQEPEHELLLALNENTEVLLETHQDSSRELRHPEMEKPYFWEFYAISDGLKGLFDRSFSYADFFCPVPPGLPDNQVAFIDALIRNARGRPVLQCCRSSGRVKALRKAFSGIHIHLWREPRSQWWSYKINDYFDAATQLIYGANRLPAVLQEVRSRCEIGYYFNYDVRDQIEAAGRSFLPVEKNYLLFYSLWMYSYIEIEEQSDISIDVIRLASDEAYKDRTLARLEELGLDGLSLSDCSMPVTRFSEEEVRSFLEVEQEVGRLFLEHGYDHRAIRAAEDAAYSIRSIGSDSIVGASRDISGDREIAIRFMGHAAELKDENEAVEKRLAELEGRLREVSNNLTEMEGSLSWRITEPLRRFNPKRIVGRFLSKIENCVDERSAVRYSVKRYLKRYPAVWNNLKRVRQFSANMRSAGGGGHQFIPIMFDGLELCFAKGPLEDQRGIGRVSRELLRHLKAASVTEFSGSGDGEFERIYFYSSIHWCPDILPVSSVIMIHDVIPLLFPDMFPAVAVEWSSKYSVIAKQAKRIVTISNTSASDISRLLNIPRHRIEVIPNGICQLSVAQDSSLKLPDKPYLVYVGSHDSHKNIEVVLTALRNPGLSNISLVMIGDNRGCQKAAVEIGVVDRVHFMGKLSDGHAGYVISNALALVFPSFYEGFGLPPFEAALVGTPTISSSRPAMTELLENAAIFVSPTDPDEWAAAIRRLLDSPELRDRIAVKARESASGFTWDASARKLLRLIKDLREFGDAPVLQTSAKDSSI